MKTKKVIYILLSFFFLLLAFGFAGAIDNGASDGYIIGALVSVILFGVFAYLGGIMGKIKL